MTFSIRSIDSGEVGKVCCELLLGEYKEVFPLITTFWTREAYESQWMDALNALIDGQVNSCVLVTDIQPPAHSVGIAYWALFKKGDFVHLQERFSRELATRLLGPANIVEMNIPPRRQGTPEEQACVSEWAVPIGELLKFIESART